MDPRVARIIDANANRAREALRLLEDAARFGLDDADLSARLKLLRHDLRAALDLLTAHAGGMLALLASRDTPADVGVHNKAPAESTRGGPHQASALRDIALAAAKRAGEALRALEECAKSFPHPADASPPSAWRRLERIRYDLYELEKRLLLALATGRAAQWTLCVLVTRDACRLDWQAVIERALAGGADCIQLREKSIPDSDLLALARRARAIVKPPAALIINDRPDIALLADADGVHLGQSDLSVEHVRRIAGDRLLVGVSTHDLDEARRAVRDGADYCGVGAIFPTATKPRPASGLDFLRAYLADPRLAATPHLAIGGITPDNIHQLAAIGCRGVAASSAICQSDHPDRACAALRAALTPAP